MKSAFLLWLGIAAFGLVEAQNLADYKGFDFLPGDKIIFQDNFSSDVVGKAPAEWRIEGGSVQVMNEGDEKFVSIKEYYTSLSPKMKTAAYLPARFTLEYDMWLDAGYDGNPGVEVQFMKGEDYVQLTPNRDRTRLMYPGGEESGEMPENVYGEKFYGRWQHIAVSFDNSKFEVYVNQNHVLSAATTFKPQSIKLTGNMSQGMPMYFRNFKLAEGGNAIATALSAGKFVTHGINFDVNKSVIRPESMGVLSEVAKYLRANPAVSFEVGGHTDSDGSDEANLALSQSRADAVQKQLISMGVNPNQLKTKGYGESSPIDVNTTPSGKANNRRVEFVKV